MKHPFRSKKSALWLLGVGLLIAGVLAFMVIAPNRAAPFGAEDPDVNVPNMQNVPPPTAPKMKLDTE